MPESEFSQTDYLLRRYREEALAKIIERELNGGSGLMWHSPTAKRETVAAELSIEEAEEHASRARRSIAAQQAWVRRRAKAGQA